MEIIDRKRDPYTDIALINVADGTLTNLTNSGYFDGEPRWVMDGNALLLPPSAMACATMHPGAQCTMSCLYS